MKKRNWLLLVGVSIFVVRPVLACEPVVPFMQVMEPTLTLSRSIVVLAFAVILKSVLFAVFERRLPRLHAAWRMFLGNVLTSFVGLVVAVMIASAPAFWLVAVPLVCGLCWLPSRRLVKAAPLTWLARIPPVALAALMTGAMVASCIFFMAGQGALQTHQHALYWTIKVAAIFLALFPSVTMTTVWEEWVIWRLSSRPEGARYFASVLRANLYVLLLVMLVPALMILPKRLHSPDFIAQKHNTVSSQTAPSYAGDVKSR